MSKHCSIIYFRCKITVLVFTLSITVMLLLTDLTNCIWRQKYWYRILPKHMWKSIADSHIDTAYEKYRWWSTSASLYPVSPPDNTFALPTEVFSSCLAIVSAVTVGGLFCGWPCDMELVIRQSERPDHQQRLLQTFTKDVFIFSLLVYIVHYSFLDDALYKYTYLLTCANTQKVSPILLGAIPIQQY